MVTLSDEILLSDYNPHKNILAIYQTNCVKFISNNQTLHILPAIIGESFHRVKFMKFDKASGNYMLIVFENGVTLIVDATCQLIKMFNIKNSSKLCDFHWNLNWPNIISLIFDRDIEVHL